MSVPLLLAALLAVACVVVVALPFLRQPDASASTDELAEPDPAARRRMELAEERDRTLAALKELEFDHRTGKITDDDYRTLVGPLRHRAGEALRALEPRPRKEHRMQPTNTIEPPAVPEPSPVPSEPPQPVHVPEPSPVPSPAPQPTPVPEPTPEPSPPTPTIDP